MKQYAIFMALVLSVANAQAADNNPSPGRAIDDAIPPHLIADEIVVLVPRRHMALHMPEHAERHLDGKVTKVEKGIMPKAIIHRADTLMMPIQAGSPVRVFLKRFPDRDAHYPIAIFPLGEAHHD